MGSMQPFSLCRPAGTFVLLPATGCRNAKRLNPLCCPKRVGALHEALAFTAVHLRSYELGGGRRILLLRYWKEGRVVEEQVLTHTQEVGEANLRIEAITDL